MSTKPTIIIVHGACHVPQNYNELTTALEAEGYEVYVPQLPTANGSRPPNSDLYDDTKCVRDTVQELLREGRNVVALLHSYGGQVGSNALHGLGFASRSGQGLRGGVSHLIYLAAQVLPEGNTMMDIVKEHGQMDLVATAFDWADDGTCASRDVKNMVIGPGRDDTETETYINKLVPWNGKCMYQPIEHAAWREIPVSYIHTTADMVVPLNYQQCFVANLTKAGRDVQTFQLETGHCPHFTATQDVVNIVLKIAA